MRPREPFNSFSHLVGAIFAVIGLVYLLVTNKLAAAPVFLIYGTTTAFLLISSTIYHWTKTAKPGLQKMDHSAIYLMIAGSYTPLALYGIGGKLCIGILIAQWTLCAIGVISTILMTKPPTWLRLVLYLVMGWMVLPLAGMLIPKITLPGFLWMVGGGLAYTIGTVVYASKRPKLWPGVFSFHELWHIFVLVGACCHFAVMTYL